MSTAVIAAIFDTWTIRIVMIDDEPWFVLADVCKALGIANSRDAAAKMLDDDEKGVENIYTLGGVQKLAVINESGLYNLIFRSSKPSAKAFRKWVTSKVLPSIRKFGVYPPPAKVLEDTQTVLVEEPRWSSPQARFMEELEAFMARSNRRYDGLMSKSQYVYLTKIAALDPRGIHLNKFLGRKDMWLRCFSAGFDMRYILWGERTLTNGEKAIVEAYRKGDTTLRSHLLARASAADLPAS